MEVEGTAEAGIGWGMPGAGGSRAPACAHQCRAQAGGGWGGLGVPSREPAAGAVSRAARKWLRFLRGRQCGATPPSARFGGPPLCPTARRI